MKRLGYTEFVAQGGDWGNAVSEQMALLAPPELLGIHTNMAATVPDDVAKALQFGDPPPSGLSADERHAYDQLDFFYKHGWAMPMKWRTAHRRSTDWPIHRSAWPPGFLTTATLPPRGHQLRAHRARLRRAGRRGLTRDDVLDNITLYWLTNTGVSSARLYWEISLPFSP